MKTAIGIAKVIAVIAVVIGGIILFVFAVRAGIAENRKQEEKGATFFAEYGESVSKSRFQPVTSTTEWGVLVDTETGVLYICVLYGGIHPIVDADGKPCLANAEG